LFREKLEAVFKAGSECMRLGEHTLEDRITLATYSSMKAP
jgi:hypothetical protein